MKDKRHIFSKSSDILQNMNFSRYYRNKDKFIYSFDPNIILYYYILLYFLSKNSKLCIQLQHSNQNYLFIVSLPWEIFKHFMYAAKADGSGYFFSASFDSTKIQFSCSNCFPFTASSSTLIWYATISHSL